LKKRFIEWDMPLAEISEESAREKNIRHGHPSTLHIWWARRPLASSRATNFAALIDLPDDLEKRKEITELIKKITPWEAVKNGNDGYIIKAQQMIKEQWGDQPPRVLDPFAGGGSIPLEALRLGCETYASDYNPVAVFIEKATLEWPQKFGVMIPNPDKKNGIDGESKKVNMLTYYLERWAKIILEEVKEEIGVFYPLNKEGSTPICYLWARTIRCQNPVCGGEIPLIKQYWLSKKSNRNVAYKPLINEKEKRINFIIQEDNEIDFDPSQGTITGAKSKCPFCGQVLRPEEIAKLAQEKTMGERLLIVIYYNVKHSGKIYKVATDTDIEIFRKAERELYKKIENWKWIDSPLPDEEINPSSKFKDLLSTRCLKYGIVSWQDLFNPRQKLALITFLEVIKKYSSKILDDISKSDYTFIKEKEEFAKSIIGYLAIMLDRITDFLTTLCILNVTGGRGVVHTFGKQSLAMTWDYAESNVFNPQGASWIATIENTIKTLEVLTSDHPRTISITNYSATSLPYPDNYFDAVLTDPPYYDNIIYSEISDFFYVWLKRSVGDIFPDIFSSPVIRKNEEIVANTSRHRSKIEAKNFFERSLSKAFIEIQRTLKLGGIALIVYAHKTTSGWETLLNSLVEAGLVVTASWPIHTERTGKFGAKYRIAVLASSIYIICRKTEREKVGFYSEIKPKIKERVETKLQQFWNEGIAGGDFFISAIGPGMEIFSQYERVEKLSGEQVTTAELLDYIRSVSTDYIVRKLLTDASSSKIDNESEFYLAYRWTYLDNTVEYDDARKLASASGVSLEKLWGPGGFVKKSGSKISVMGPKERGDVDPIKSMVDVMHKCLLLWEKGKKEELAELLAKTGYADNPAFKQFCQAVAESLLNGNKEKQLLEGFLIGIDTYKRGEVKVPKAQTKLKEFGGY